MISKDWKKEFLTIPNLLSLFRLVLIPVYVTLYLRAESVADYFIAAGVLAVSCLTDLIDGKIARPFNMISNTGKILDPLADKATQFTLIVCLLIRRQKRNGIQILLIRNLPQLSGRTGQRRTAQPSPTASIAPPAAAGSCRQPPAPASHSPSALPSQAEQQPAQAA